MTTAPALHIYMGGTTGATDGTLEVGGDEQGLTLAVGATGVLHLRCDEGGQTDEGVVVNAPTGCEVSADGVTFGATATYPAGSIQDVNVVCHVKRTATGLTEDEWRGGTTTPRLALVAVEPIPAENVAPAAFTPTISDITQTGATVTFATTDPDGDALTYRLALSSSSTPPAGIINGTSPIVTSPYSRDGLTPESSHYVHVRAEDGKGGVTIGTPVMFTTAAAPAGDTTAPAIAGTLTATPTATQGQVALAGPTATDNVGIAKWQYQVDAGAWVDVASTSTTFPTTNVSGLSIALHDFAVRAVDAAANASTTKTASATVADITAPAIAGTLVATVDGSEQVTLSGVTATDNVGIAKWQYRVDSDAWVDVASTSGTFPSTEVGGLEAETAYTFGVRALDAAGNPSAEKTASAVVELVEWADNFNRADSTTVGNGWQSRGYVASGGTEPTVYGVKDNALYVKADSDHTTSLFMGRVAAGSVGVGVRLGSGQTYLYPASSVNRGVHPAETYSNDGYVLIVNPDTSLFLLRRLDNGATVNLVNDPVATAQGALVAVKRSGNDLVMYVDGTEVKRVTDATYMTNLGYVGLMIATTNVIGATATADDFKVY